MTLESTRVGSDPIVPSWDVLFILQAALVATKSKDRSTKVGAIAVHPKTHVMLSSGYNGFPRGVDDNNPAYHERPLKYEITEHAERNMCYNAARHGISLEGSWVYMNFSPVPCSDCARALIQSGITTIVGPDIAYPGKGQAIIDSLATSRRMLSEAGVRLVTVNHVIGIGPPSVHYAEM